jgi:hypothetical protein
VGKKSDCDSHPAFEARLRAFLIPVLLMNLPPDGLITNRKLFCQPGPGLPKSVKLYITILARVNTKNQSSFQAQSDL